MKYSNKNIKHIYPGESPKLPDEYQEVEYLESSGTQYINTGWVNNNKAIHSYKMKFQALALTEGGFFGPFATSAIRPGTLWLSVNAKAFKMSIGSDNSAVSKVSYAYDNSIHTFTNEINENEKTYRIAYDNEESYKTYSGSVYSNISNCLFRSSTSTYSPISARIFYFVICENGQEVRHLIPCYRKSDNKPGMYDLVNDVFYTNAGSGEFTVGADVNYKRVLHIEDEHGTVFNDVPIGYTKLDYIETNGTNYIDAGLKVNNSDMFEFEAKWERLSLTEFTGLFWYRTQSSNNYPSIMCILNYNANGDNFRLANYANGNATTNKVSNTSGTNTVYYKTVGNRCNINGTSYTYAYQIYNYSNMPNFDFYFPARYLQGTDTEGYKFYAVRVYFFNIYNKTTGQPLRLFVPAKQDSTGKIGMLELKSGTFYERQGTGEFGYRESNTGTVVQPT